MCRLEARKAGGWLAGGSSMGWERPGPDSILARGQPTPPLRLPSLLVLLCAQVLHKVFDLTRGDGRRWSLRQDRRPGSLAPVNVNQRQFKTSTPPNVPNVHLPSPRLSHLPPPLPLPHPSPAGDFNRPCPNPFPVPPFDLRYYCSNARPTSAHNHMHMLVESHEAATCSSSFTHSLTHSSAPACALY